MKRPITFVAVPARLRWSNASVLMFTAVMFGIAGVVEDWPLGLTLGTSLPFAALTAFVLGTKVKYTVDSARERVVRTVGVLGFGATREIPWDSMKGLHVSHRAIVHDGHHRDTHYVVSLVCQCLTGGAAPRASVTLSRAEQEKNKAKIESDLFQRPSYTDN